MARGEPRDRRGHDRRRPRGRHRQADAAARAERRRPGGGRARRRHARDVPHRPGRRSVRRGNCRKPCRSRRRRSTRSRWPRPGTGSTTSRATAASRARAAARRAARARLERARPVGALGRRGVVDHGPGREERPVARPRELARQRRCPGNAGIRRAARRRVPPPPIDHPRGRRPTRRFGEPRRGAARRRAEGRARRGPSAPGYASGDPGPRVGRNPLPRRLLLGQRRCCSRRQIPDECVSMDGPRPARKGATG